MDEIPRLQPALCPACLCTRFRYGILGLLRHISSVIAVMRPRRLASCSTAWRILSSSVPIQGDAAALNDQLAYSYVLAVWVKSSSLTAHTDWKFE
jgi:hypothetical protein